jgi:hypothetical protein
MDARDQFGKLELIVKIPGEQNHPPNQWMAETIDVLRG